MTWGSHKKSYLLNGSAIDVCLWRLCVYQRLSYRMVSYRNGVSTFSKKKKRGRGTLMTFTLPGAHLPISCFVCLSGMSCLSFVLQHEHEHELAVYFASLFSSDKSSSLTFFLAVHLWGLGFHLSHSMNLHILPPVLSSSYSTKFVLHHA